MKRLGLILIVLAIFLAVTACGNSYLNRPSKPAIPRTYGGVVVTRCILAWEQMDVDKGNEATIASLIINREHLPDSVGFVLKKCINGGWTGWR